MKTLAQQWSDREKLIDASEGVKGLAPERVAEVKQLAKKAWLEGVNVGIQMSGDIGKITNKKSAREQFGALMEELNRLLFWKK